MRSHDEVLADMRQLGKRMAALQGSLAEMFDQRLALLREGREVVPPVKHVEAGEAFGIGHSGVLKALRDKAKSA